MFSFCVFIVGFFMCLCVCFVVVVVVVSVCVCVSFLSARVFFLFREGAEGVSACQLLLNIYRSSVLAAQSDVQ